jgi:glycine/D-amino acid oxidase-like deaminating enzyme/nitrite reductase/ring-hydroxylating ferredoxin subunit
MADGGTAPHGETAHVPSLEATEPLWVATAQGRPFPRLESEIEVDVAIVGGGITGLTAAELLSSAGRRVAVLAARAIARGESGSTTAHLTAYPDAGLAKLIARFGSEETAQVWRAGAAAIRHIEETAARYGVECGFRRLPGHRYSEGERGLRELEEELEASRRIGAPARWLDEPPFPRARAALRFEDQGQFHPRRYLLALADAVARRGSEVFEETRTLEVEDDESAPVVTTAHGRVRARDVIVAANVPINNRVWLQTKIAHYRTYALAVCTAGDGDDTPGEGLWWDDQDPYHYVRRHREGDVSYLIAGGEDHRTGQDADTSARFEKLLAWTEERFPVASVEHLWSGQIVEPVDGLPYIGRNSFSDHVWEATGFSGNGMTFGTLAGVLLAERILGREPGPWDDLFDATRITPLASGWSYVEENVAFPVRFIGDRLKSEPTELADLARGDGSLFVIAGRKVAVHRDLAGELHALSPVCTHLRCLVEFNRAEKSWDCPCHGSRYDITGEVLNGPATRGLDKIRLVSQNEQFLRNLRPR